MKVGDKVKLKINGVKRTATVVNHAVDAEMIEDGEGRFHLGKRVETLVLTIDPTKARP